VLLVGVSVAVMLCRPVTAGRQLHVAVCIEPLPVVDTARQLALRFPLRKKRTLPAALTVTVVAIEIPLNGVPLIDGAEAVPDSLTLVTVIVTVCESESDPSETQVITM
jgi:hypothetical protein